MALDALRERLASKDLLKNDPLTPAVASEAARHEWISSGLLVSWRDLSDAWGGRSRQALDQACDRGDLFSLKVAGKRWYPGVFRMLPAEAVKAVNRRLANVDPASKLIFWTRPQGPLGGQTLAEAILANQLERAEQVAKAFADEFTGHAALA